MPDIDKKAELAKLKAALAAVQADSTARDADTALDEELADAARALADAKAIAEAERALGKKCLATYDTPRGVVIVKRPNHLLFRKFMDAGEMTVAVCEELIRPCLVHPSRDVFDSYSEEYPAIIIPVANRIAQLAGSRSKDQLGK